jgi:quinol monooxygenase YgiN
MNHRFVGSGRGPVVKVIVELRAEPGRRDELKSLLESIVANEGPSQRGFLGSTRYEVLDDPDILIEVAEWESAEARTAHMEEAAATGAYTPLLEMLAVPLKATVIRQLP